MDDEDNAASRVPERRDPSSPADMGSLTTIGVEFADPQLEASVRAGLDAVDSTLRTAVRSDDPFIAEAARYLVDAGGKRFRPLMTVLAAHFGDASAPQIVRAADILADLGPAAGRLQARTFERLVTGQIRETIGPAAGDDPISHCLGVLAEK